MQSSKSSRKIFQFCFDHFISRCIRSELFLVDSCCTATGYKTVRKHWASGPNAWHLGSFVGAMVVDGCCGGGDVPFPSVGDEERESEVISDSFRDADLKRQDKLKSSISKSCKSFPWR